MAQPPTNRRKPASRRKDANLRVRVTVAQKTRIKQAAEKAEMTVSDWVIAKLMKVLGDETG